MTPGKILYIPPYWWYTFKFDKDTSVSCFKYRTYMNNIAISPKIFMYALQNQNVERKIAKKINITNNSDPKKDTTSIVNLDLIKESSDTMASDGIIPESLLTETEVQIPEILIPKEEPEPMPQFEFKGGTELLMPT